MNLQEIINEFDTNGTFPTDLQMTVAIKNSSYTNIYELEMDLLEKANDTNHPYHSMTSGGPNSEFNTKMNDWINELAKN